jgi:hypothetical protein
MALGRLARGICWIGSNWWRLSDLRRVAWACRAQLLSVVIGGGLIALTDQARDIVIASAAGKEGLGNKLGLIATMLFWASVSWYWARVTLNFSFSLPAINRDAREWAGLSWSDRRRRVEWRHLWLEQMPRLIGAASVLSVAIAFLKAAGIYHDAESPTAPTFYAWAAGFALLAGGFYWLVARRTRILEALLGHPPRWAFRLRLSAGPHGALYRNLVPRRVSYGRLRDYANPVAVCFLGGSLLLAPILSSLFILHPIGMSAAFGDAVRAVLCGLAIMVPIVSLLVLVSQTLRVPIFGMVVLWMAFSHLLLGDNHDVRTMPQTSGQFEAQRAAQAACEVADARRAKMGGLFRPTIDEAYRAWYKANSELPRPADAAPDMPAVQPLIMVATAGGASRAAFWTSQVLGEIAAREPHFSDRLFMISGVSGGSLGAMTFRSLVEAKRRGGASGPAEESFAAKAADFLKNDFLTPALATGLYVDLPYHAFPFLPAPADRAVALEKGWEANAVEHVVAGGKVPFNWSDGFVATFGTSQPVWPILALNGTSVEKGKRLIFSNVDFACSGLAGPLTRYDGIAVLGNDIPISTAVTMSARFPIISPAGGLRDFGGDVRMRVTDGGLFENFGAVTADEVMHYVIERRRDAQEGKEIVAPIAILISSDPSLDLLDGVTNTGIVRNVIDKSPPPYRNLSTPDCDGRRPVASAIGNNWPECPLDARKSSSALVDPALALYDGRVARGEMAAIALLDRIVATSIPVRDHLADRLLKDKYGGDPAQRELAVIEARQRLGKDNHVDFFHFRQCRMQNRKTPTMSWHDSEEAWDAMRDMTGLDPTKGDECGNAAEFFRLCTRLARLSGAAADDRAATTYCEKSHGPGPAAWVKPKDWTCLVDRTHPGAPDICGIYK